MGQSAGKPVVSKADAAAFVHTAKEMEISVYTLRELASDLRERADNVPIDEAKEEVKCCKEQIESKQLEIMIVQRSIQDQKENHVKKEKFSLIEHFRDTRSFFSKDHPFLCILILDVLFVVPMAIAAFLDGSFAEEGQVALNISFSLGMSVLAAILPSIFYLMLIDRWPFTAFPPILLYTLVSAPFAAISHSLKEKKRLEQFPQQQAEKVKSLQNELACAEAALANEQRNLANAKNDLQRQETLAKCLRAEARAAEEKASQINSILQECYRVTGIVGPDYRHIDCLLVFDHVFRNDLADTVRDAVFYYEEKKFRDMVKSGMGSIFEMLGDMASNLRYVEYALNDIRSDVIRLGSSFSSQIEHQHQIESNQEKLLKEAKATYYAIEKHNAAEQAYHDYVKSKLS